MLTYNQRYRPRTTREYTKSDLTVYDSAGNTALNALTVYGKSEVVDGAIKSAGEGWATVDLGTLDWATSSAPEKNVFRASLDNVSPAIKQPADAQTLGNYLLGEYLQKTWGPLSANDNGCYGISNDAPARISLIDHDYDNVADFVTHISGVMLAYEIIDPTQGNAIAVKTDNGTGIDGTMAVFETGTPLRSIPDTNVRDVMEWDGSSGEVTKKCGKVRLADLTWTAYNTIYYAPISDKINNQNNTGICSSYNIINSNPTSAGEAVALLMDNNSLALSKDTSTPYVYIRADNYTTVSDFVASLGDAELVYELATPTTTPLAQTENESLAGLRTFDGTTHFINNAVTDMTVNYTIRVPTIN